MSGQLQVSPPCRRSAWPQTACPPGPMSRNANSFLLAGQLATQKRHISRASIDHHDGVLRVVDLGRRLRVRSSGPTITS